MMIVSGIVLYSIFGSSITVLLVVEVYILYAPLPSDLSSPQHLIGMVHASVKIICAWGNKTIVHKLMGKYDTAPLRGFEHKLYDLALSIDGTPKHPLYLPKTLTPQKHEPCQALRKLI